MSKTFLPRQRSNVVAVFDIGSSKIVCLIARLLNSGDYQALGVGYSASIGIRAGIIVDIKSAENSILSAIEMAEAACNEKIKRAYVNTPSSNLLSHRMTLQIDVAGREINNKDLNKLLLEATSHYQKQEVEIIHTFAYDYILDGNRGITSPLGMFGNKLGSDVHVLSVPSNVLTNISTCLTKCGLSVESYISSAYATGRACLTTDEMALGVILLEFGAGSTSVSVFENNQMIYTDGIPLGGISITNDIARGVGINFDSAERVKNLYGAVIMTSLDSHEDIDMTSKSNNEECEYNEVERNTINRSLLIEIVRARVEEIIELVIRKLSESAMLSRRPVVITGCTAQISGMRELVAHMFSTKVRIGHSKMAKELCSSLENQQTLNASVFTTVSGMLSHVIEHTREGGHVAGETEMHSSIFKRFYKTFYRYFSE